MGEIEKDSFVVISDFHSCENPLNKVKEYYINEYDKIFILGDATDRGNYGDGTYGVEILLRIKKLTEQYPERVIYIPGNHDEFLYGYAKDNDPMSYQCLDYNHGSQTIKDINDLSDNEREDLINWLGNLPLQREHYYNTKRFVLVHALFNEKLYKENPGFSLEDYRKANGNNGRYYNILWFRKQSDTYDPSWLPEKGTTMIIGHTPAAYRGNLNLSLKNQYGNIIEVHCVDGGITYGGTMLKFCGYGGKERLLKTYPFEHNPPKPTEKRHITRQREKEYIESWIINNLKEAVRSTDLEESLEKSISDLINSIYRNKIYGRTIIFEDNALSADTIIEYLDEQYEGYKQYIDENYIDVLKRYFTDVGLEYIINQLSKYRDRKSVKKCLNNCLLNKNVGYITSIGGARTVALNLAPFIIRKFESEKITVDEFVDKILGKQYTS